MEVFGQFFFLPKPQITEKNIPSQNGRVFIVTGGYGGVGYELSQILFASGSVVYVAGRSRVKADGAIDRIKKASPDSSGRIEFLELDLSDLSTIKPAVNNFLEREQRLDVLVNNAAVMYPPDGSKDAHGNDLQVGTNCLGHYLLHSLLEPILTQTAASSPPGSVRVAWAASIAVDVASPKPDGMVFEDDGKPKDLGIEMNYGQTKVANVFYARHFASKTPNTGVVHVAFNPGNLRTGLQRHWSGMGPKIADATILHDAIWGAYTELYAALSPDISRENSGAYILPWGKVGGFRAGVEAALKPTSDGGTGVAAKFISWTEKQTAAFV